ncbi:MAG TPA: type II toxin-antitoxin system RelE/ParE family toxin [Thermoanaerobaculia bacterium]|nr:type II toxin-antitoxin system RelE/ParE family toxin [Thermoanaerobaculia bacterium]
MGKYSVRIKKSAARELDAIPGKKDRRRLVERIRALADDPRPAGAEKLSGFKDRYRIRQGNYRVLYEIEDEVLVVYVVKVADRKEVYRRGG